MSMITRRLESIVKHASALLAQSEALDRLQEAARKGASANGSFLEYDIACSLLDGEDCVADAYVLIKDADKAFTQAARLHGRMMTHKQKAKQ